jgi:hypothetical protein
MKTITIPKRFGYPTAKITANGKEYILKSGEEITVEDHIAEIIENAIALEPKPKSAALTGGIALVVEANEERTKLLTPLNDIRDAWLSGRSVILPLTRNGYTNIFTMVTGGVNADGSFRSAQFSRISDTGTEIYAVESNGTLVYRLLE